MLSLPARADWRGQAICGVPPNEATALTHQMTRDTDEAVLWKSYGPEAISEGIVGNPYSDEDSVLGRVTNRADEVNATLVCELDAPLIQLQVPDGFTTVKLRFWRIGRDLIRDEDQDARKWLVGSFPTVAQPPPENITGTPNERACELIPANEAVAMVWEVDQLWNGLTTASNTLASLMPLEASVTDALGLPGLARPPDCVIPVNAHKTNRSIAISVKVYRLGVPAAANRLTVLGVMSTLSPWPF